MKMIFLSKKLKIFYKSALQGLKQVALYFTFTLVDMLYVDFIAVYLL